jgi:hypothetical protein
MLICSAATGHALLSANLIFNYRACLMRVRKNKEKLGSKKSAKTDLQ